MTGPVIATATDDGLCSGSAGTAQPRSAVARGGHGASRSAGSPLTPATAPDAVAASPAASVPPPLAPPLPPPPMPPLPPPPPVSTAGGGCGTGYSPGGQDHLCTADAVLAAAVALPRLLPGATTQPDSAVVAARIADATVRPD